MAGEEATMTLEAEATEATGCVDEADVTTLEAEATEAADCADEAALPGVSDATAVLPGTDEGVLGVAGITGINRLRS